MTKEEEKAVENLRLAKEIEGLVHKYNASFSDGTYKEAVDLMAPGMTVYSNFGVLQTVPEDKSECLAVYEDLHERGFRLVLGAQYVRVDRVAANVAVATFLAEGTGVAPGSERTEKLLRRMTQIWSKERGNWQIAHIHSSNLRTLKTLAEQVDG